MTLRFSGIHLPRAFPALALALWLMVGVGCDKSDGIVSYSVPKEVPPVVQATEDKPIEWTVPEGWKALPAKEMRFAAYSVSDDHSDVALTVIPLPLAQSPLLQNVNRWQKQVSLPESPAAELPNVVRRVEISPETSADTVDLSGTDPKTNAPVRMLAAMVPHDDQVWFIKLMGPPDVVGPQKDKFDAFLKSIKFHAHDPAGASASTTSDPSAGPNKAVGPVPAPPLKGGPFATTAPKNVKLTWTSLPAGWTEEKVTQQFRQHTIKVTSGDQTADLAVTRMTIEQAGPLLDNINRWRMAVGLQPTEDPSGYAPQNVTIAGGPGFIIEVKGAEKTVLAGLTEAGEQLWFFKLTGPSALVAAQRPSFESFLKSVRFVGE